MAFTARHKRLSHLVFLCLGGLTLLLSAQMASAATTLYWDPMHTLSTTGGGPGTWDTSTSNWFNGTADVAWINNNNDTAVFNGTAGAVTLGAGIIADQLQVNTSGYIISSPSGYTLTLKDSSNSIIVAAGVTVTISTKINNTLSPNNINVTTGTASVLTLNSPSTSMAIGTSSGGLFIVNGSGTVLLSASLFNNGQTINGGTLKMAADNKLYARVVNIASGAVLDLNGTTQSPDYLNDATAPGGSVINSGASIANLSLGNHSNGSIGTFSGTISNAVNLTKAGTGTQTLSGANTYMGTTTINVGTLTVSGGSAIPDSSAVTLANTSGATLNLSTSETIGSLTGGGTTGGNVTLGATTLTTGGDNTSPAAYAGVISSTGGGLTKIGTGTQTLSGANNYTGTTTISGGTLQLSVANAINAASAMTLNGGIFNTGGLSQTFTTPLTLSSSSGIDLGSSEASVLTYADSSGASWTGTLSVFNWSGNTAGNGTGPDRLYFGTAATLGATKVSEIKFVNPTGYPTTPTGVYRATQQSNGEVTPNGTTATATFVTLMSFTATRYSTVLWLNWQTGLEVDNLGFNVYREVGGKKVRLNGNDLIAGSAIQNGSNSGCTYAWPDVLTPGAKYWLEDVDLSGKSTWHGPITPRPGIGAAGALRRSPVLGQ